MAALYRFGAEALPDGRPVLLAVVAAATMTLGNLAAFAQDNVRRLLAYSTVAQAGYLLVPVAMADRSDLAQPALLYYLGAYAVTNVGAFAVVLATGRDDLGGYAGLMRGSPSSACPSSSASSGSSARRRAPCSSGRSSCSARPSTADTSGSPRSRP
ncbi:proton-conducting transporter transmembrane domain-containing protein [Actinomadura madurae]|uniref:proton-conducting transporter transmembrane domain-containing protein n=1 Tax=Actinomadura madurae TaxID=1993 RepID=UPI0020D20FCE|nr:proton-conducting transporter membrane subunit [Actinomadura madurae]